MPNEYFEEAKLFRSEAESAVQGYIDAANTIGLKPYEQRSKSEMAYMRSLLDLTSRCLEYLTNKGAQFAAGGEVGEATRDVISRIARLTSELVHESGADAFEPNVSRQLASAKKDGDLPTDVAIKELRLATGVVLHPESSRTDDRTYKIIDGLALDSATLLKLLGSNDGLKLVYADNSGQLTDKYIAGNLRSLELQRRNLLKGTVDGIGRTALES